MKNVLTLTAIIATMATTANAETVTDVTKQVIHKTPYTVEVCTDSQQRGNGKSEIENFIEGAIVGGALGNNIPGEKNGGALGAFLGGIYNTERNKGQTGPVCRVETRYNEEVVTIYSHSVVTFVHDGKQYQLKFQK